MKLFDILRVYLPDLTPEDCKVHLAVWNGYEHPFDVYRQGKFEAWQSWQSKKFFDRRYIVSLVRMPGSDSHWLFAGCFLPCGAKPHPKAPGAWLYETTEVGACKEDLAGKLVVRHAKDYRPHVRKAEAIAEDIDVVELRARPISNVVFTSYNDVRLTKDELDLVVRTNDSEWVSALSSVLGIYVITDTSNGKLYVGSAGADTKHKGAGGIWRRWCDYSRDGHGGDVELRKVLEEHGVEHAKNFQYSILEIIPPQADAEQVKMREGYWKRVLASYTFGYNLNLERDAERSY